MPFKIKVRLIELGKKQADLIPELAKRGIRANPTELSQALTGQCQQTKAQAIVSAANEIVAEWEKGKRKPMAASKLTFEEIKALDKEMLTPTEVSGVLGCAPYNINVLAKQAPELLGFPVTFSGRNVKIPRRAFINFMEGKNE